MSLIPKVKTILVKRNTKSVRKMTESDNNQEPFLPLGRKNNNKTVRGTNVDEAK